MALRRDEKYYSKERANYYNSFIKVVQQEAKYTDLPFVEFVYRYFPHHTQNEFGEQVKLAKFHEELAQKIIEADKIEAVIQMSRNHAKTTVFGLFLPIYLMLTGRTHFVLYVAASKDLAVKQLINIQSELENNTLLINEFGEFTKQGNWAKGNFIVERYDTAFYCLGKGQSTRGLKYKSYRPDFVIVDDIDTDKDVLNPVTITKQTNWVLQNVFPAMSVKKYRFIMLGNRFAPDMVLSRVMEEMPGIEILKVNALDEDGNPNWPERFTRSDLLRIKEKIGTIRFQREYMNTPIVEGMVFKPEWIQKFTNGSHKYDIIITYIDPSYTKDGDFKAAITVGVKEGMYYVLKMWVKRATMTALWDYLYTLDTTNHRMYIEAGFGQEMHRKTYIEAMNKYGYALPIVWDKRKKSNKVSRIEGLATYFEQGRIFINTHIFDTTDWKEFYTEYISFPQAKNDDALDALESAIYTINELLRKRTKAIIGSKNRTIW